MPYSSCLHLGALLNELQELVIALWSTHLDALIAPKPPCTRFGSGAQLICTLTLVLHCDTVKLMLQQAAWQVLAVRVGCRKRQAAIGHGRSGGAGSTVPGVGQLVVLYSRRSNAWQGSPARRQYQDTVQVVQLHVVALYSVARGLVSSCRCIMLVPQRHTIPFCCTVVCPGPLSTDQPPLLTPDTSKKGHSGQPGSQALGCQQA